MFAKALILFTRAGLGDAPALSSQKLPDICFGLIHPGTPPQTLAFYGDGVKLTCEGSSVLEPPSPRRQGDKPDDLSDPPGLFAAACPCARSDNWGNGDIVAAMGSADKVISV